MSEDESSVYKSKCAESLSTESSFQQLPTLKAPCQSFLPKVQTASQSGEITYNATERQNVICGETLPQRGNQCSDPNQQQVPFPPEYEYHTFTNPTLASNVDNGIRTAKNTPDKESSPKAPNVRESVFESMMLLQQQQTETLISTHQQLTTSMALPQPSINIFKGDPLEYRTFVMSFDTRIQYRVTNSADQLYYLNQHLSGEPKDMVEGCLHMDPDKGYSEARRLLKQEYGDPYKIPMEISISRKS